MEKNGEPNHLSESGQGIRGEEEPVPILLVDDLPQNLIALSATLESPAYRIVQAHAGREALEYVRLQDFAVILLDVQMPDIDGFEVARRIRSLERSKTTPIIFVTAISKEDKSIEEAYRLGGVDYLPKPIDLHILHAKVTMFTDLYRARREVARQGELLRQQERQERFQVLENSLDAIVGVDQDDRIIDWNKRAEEIFGWTKNQAMGRPMRRLLIPERYRESHRRGMEHFLSSGEGPILDRRIEVSALKRDGSEFPIELSVTAIKTPRGYKFYSFIRDLTELKERERLHREARDQLQIIFEHVADGILVQDQNFHCVYANKAGAHLCGYNSTEEFIKAPVLEAIERFEILTEAGDPFPIEQLPARQVFNGIQNPPEAVLRVRNKKTGEESWSSVTSRAILNESGKPYLAVSIFRDVTIQKRVADALKQAKIDAEHLAEERTRELKIELEERVQREEELRKLAKKIESQARMFDTALSSSPDFSYVFDTHHRFIYVNHPLLKLWGLTLEQAYGKTFADLNYPPELCKLHESQLNQVLQTKQPVRGENAYTNYEGKTGYYEYIFIPIFDEQGNVQAISGTTRDVTERKLSEEAKLEKQRADLIYQQVRHSEEQFRTLAESIPQLAWMAHPDGHIFWYNRRWYEYTGTTPEEMEGWGWQSVHDPKELPRVLEQWKHSIATGQSFSCEFPLKAANGRYSWFLTQASPVKDDQGNVVRWFGTNTNIDQQRKNREALRFLAQATDALNSSLNYNETLRKLADLAVPSLADWCGIDVVEEDGPRSVAIAHPDPEMIRTAALIREEYPTDWSSPTGAPNVIRTGKAELYPEISEDLLAKAARSEDHFRLLKRFEMRSALVVPIQGRGKTLGALTLISTRPDRHYSQEDLSLAEELGRRAAIAIDNARLYCASQEAIKVRDEFLSIASHELRTPLTPIKLQLQNLGLMIKKGQLTKLSPERVKRVVDTSDKQLSRLTALIEDLLDVARISSGKLKLNPESQDLVGMVREACERYSTQASATGTTFEIHAPDSAIANFDRLRMEQVIINLLTNAIKYAPGKPLRIRIEKTGSAIQVSVRDHGIGISANDLLRIFDRFERVHSTNNVGGLGLGLYISRQIVEAHGGRIWAESELGKGSTFTFEIPLEYKRRELSS